jgi:hypothetical protein
MSFIGALRNMVRLGNEIFLQLVAGTEPFWPPGPQATGNKRRSADEEDGEEN